MTTSSINLFDRVPSEMHLAISCFLADENCLQIRAVSRTFKRFTDQTIVDRARYRAGIPIQELRATLEMRWLDIQAFQDAQGNIIEQASVMFSSKPLQKLEDRTCHSTFIQRTRNYFACKSFFQSGINGGM